MNETTFRILFTLALAGNALIVSLYRRRAQAGESFSYEEEGKAVAVPLRVAGLAMWLSAVLYIVAPKLLPWSLVELPAALRLLGASVALVAVPALTIWAQRSLGTNVSTTVITRKAHELVTHGPYRYVRLPLYSIGMLFFGSLAILSGSWLLAGSALATFGMIVIRTPLEEAKLQERFGEAYREYLAGTGRFLPQIRWTASGVFRGTEVQRR